MKISHEVPVELFADSQYFNDYPYVLGHLIKLNPDYKEFYKEQLEVADFSILDNSAFELGKSIPFDELMSVARELKPTHLVLPDTVHDMNRTLIDSLDFLDEFGKELDELNIEPIGVVQGDTFGELYNCIQKYIYAGIFYIAIPFDCIKDEDYSQVRFRFFRYLIEKMDTSLIAQLEFHFLGIQNPQEMLLYNQSEKELITSIDSSSPILHGVTGNEFKEWGVSEQKPKIKLADNLDITLTKEQESLIQNNINFFRKYCNG